MGKIFLLSTLLVLILCGVTFAGAPISSNRTKHSVTSYSTGTWTTLNSAIAKTSNWVHAYNSSLSGTLIIGQGDSGSETQVLVLNAGSDLVVPLRVVKGVRISIKSADASVTTGNSVFEFYE